MKRYTMNELPEHSIYTGTLPFAGEENKNEQANDKPANSESHTIKKKYHSSAMYAASLWHKSVGHVKIHSHKPLDIYNQ